MTSQYDGPERRSVHVSPADVLKLAESIENLNGRVGRMAVAIETVGEVQERQARIEEEQARLRKDTVTKADLAERERQRRSRFWTAVVAISIVVVASAVAITVLVYALRKEHRDFVALRNQSVNSCHTRNDQAKNQLTLYKSVATLLADAEKRSPDPILQDAVNAFANAASQVPPLVDCNRLAGIGR